MEGFVAEEGHDLLPPKSVDRTNLIDCYQALMLAAFMEEGLFHVSYVTMTTMDGASNDLFSKGVSSFSIIVVLHDN
jgi:uncharacterized membrane protein YukC